MVYQMLLFRTWIKKNTACQALRMCFQSMASRLAAPTAPRSLSQMQMFRLHLRLAESGTLGWGPGFRGITSLPRNGDACSILRATTLGGKKIVFFPTFTFLPWPSWAFPLTGEKKKNEGLNNERSTSKSWRFTTQAQGGWLSWMWIVFWTHIQAGCTLWQGPGTSLSSSSSESNVQPGLGTTGKAVLNIISEATGESDPLDQGWQTFSAKQQMVRTSGAVPQPHCCHMTHSQTTGQAMGTAVLQYDSAKLEFHIIFMCHKYSSLDFSQTSENVKTILCS